MEELKISEGILIALISGAVAFITSYLQTRFEKIKIKKEYQNSFYLKLLESRFEVYPKALKGLTKLMNYKNYFDDGHTLMVSELEGDADIVNIWFMTVGSTYMSDASISAYQQFSFEIDMFRSKGEGILSYKDAELITDTAKKLFDQLRNDLKPKTVENLS